MPQKAASPLAYPATSNPLALTPSLAPRDWMLRYRLLSICQKPSVRYGVGATGWLAAVIVTGAGGDTLALSAATSGIAVGTYSARVFLGSSKATPKTIKVVLTMGVDAPSRE